MNDAGSRSSKTSKSYSPTGSDDLLPPINLPTRPQGGDSAGWSEADVTRENWRRPTPDNTSPFSAAVRRPPSVTLQKLSFPSNMASFAKDKPATSIDPSSNWRSNAYDDLSNDIVRLSVNDVAGDPVEKVSIRTPPKTKGPNSASPMGTSSTPSATSSPHGSDQLGLSHSREVSGDSGMTRNNGLLNASNNLKPNGQNDSKERPHSYSGGISTADLRRLQTTGDGEGADGQPWTPTQHRNSTDSDQLSYPTLSNNTPTSQRAPYEFRSNVQRDEPQDSNGFVNPLSPPNGQFSAGGRSGGVNPQFRPNQRGFPQQNMMGGPGVAYGPGPQIPNALGNSQQQLYDMMLAGSVEAHPGVNRMQPQANVYRGTHQHSPSDPSNPRDGAPMGMMNNGMQGFPPGMFPAGLAGPAGMPMYPNQFYGGQDAYVRPDLQAMAAARLQQQYTGPYGMVAQPVESALASPASTHGSQNGPSANNRKLGLYKTELCRSWEEKGSCRYGAKCQFAHGEEELRLVARHPKYKTEICRTFWVSGSCPYGKRCCFIHTELPAAGHAPGTAPSEPPQPPPQDGRARSMSTNSDPNEGGVSLLARISAKRNQDAPTPVDTNGNYQFAKPPTGSLRVDTSSLDTSATMKQNKSAYPSFASNGILMAAPEPQAKSPGPVTAGPDLGRHAAAARGEIVGYNQRLSNSGTPPSHNPRHSLGGNEDVAVNFTNSPPVGGHAYTLSGESNQAVNAPTGRPNGHVRAGSAGNWGSIARQNYNFGPASAFPSQDSGNVNSPWATNELGPSRLNEKAWA